MIIFGGTIPLHTNRVWVLTNANGLGGTSDWIELAPSGSLPTPRELHSAVYDGATNTMVISGGWNGSLATPYLGDTWILSGANGLQGTPTWSALTPPGNAPEARFAHAALRLYDYGVMFVLAGQKNSGGFDGWTLFRAYEP
jgi:hypothetical protein